MFDMAVGEQLTSAYNGSFRMVSQQNEDIISHINTFDRTGNKIPDQLNAIYKKVGDWRKEKLMLPDLSHLLQEIHLLDNNDWLVAFELLEIAQRNRDVSNTKRIRNYLKSMPKTYQHLIH